MRKIKQLDKDIYFDDIEIKPTHQEAVKEIEMLILEREVEDGIQKD